MNRKKFTLVPYGVKGDYKGELPLILPGHLPRDAVRTRPELRDYARSHPELPMCSPPSHGCSALLGLTPSRWKMPTTGT